MSRRPRRARFARTLFTYVTPPAVLAFACGGPTDAPASGDEAARDANAIVAAASFVPASADLIWRSKTTGAVGAWRTRDGGATLDSIYGLPTVSDLAWGLEAAGDFDGNGSTDLAWQYYPTGATMLWLMRDETVTSAVDSQPMPGLGWRFGASADFDRDGRDDLVLRNDQTGETRIRYMNGAAARETLNAPSVSGFELIGAGYFDDDATPDLAWRNQADGRVSYWAMRGKLGNEYSYQWTLNAPLPDPSWLPREVADVNGDGRPDIVWRRPSTGENQYWLLATGGPPKVAPAPVAGTDWGVYAARRRHARVTHTIADVLAARASFLQARDASHLFTAAAPAVADAYAAAHGVARYEVRYGRFDADKMLYLGVTGYDASGAVRLAVDFTVGQNELERLYRAFNEGEPITSISAYNSQGAPQTRAASALGADARATLDGLEASLKASLQAAGALGAAARPPAPSAAVINPNTQPPTADDEDRSVLQPCIAGFVGIAFSMASCPAATKQSWATAACVLGVAAAVLGGGSCACALGVPPLGSETWNVPSGQEFCSCERTTGREESWIDESPRSPGDATCYTCPEGFVRARRFSCFGSECGTQYLDSCVNCPVGTFSSENDPNRCVCADGSDPTGTVPLANGQVAAKCPGGWYSVGGFRTRRTNDCQRSFNGCYVDQCKAEPWKPGLVGVSPSDALNGTGCPEGTGSSLCEIAEHAWCHPPAPCDATARTENEGYRTSVPASAVDTTLPTMVSCLAGKGLRVFVDYSPPLQP